MEEEQNREGRLSRLMRWFDSRLGLSYPLLRPAPQYSINPFYWLGALAVVAFVIQGITGVIMMLYYVPSPGQAYSSTLYIFQKVYFGQLLQAVHLYTAYAMIMLAFMHMMRGYFVSVHKKPREIMWVVGMVMGFVTLGFGFTGYLLPWTVVSKSATDVGIGMIQALPQPVSSFVSFLVVGAGGDATQLLRFYDLHVVVLPAVLLVLLVVKMYMLESHGIAEPASGVASPVAVKFVPIFPDVSLYLLELAALFGSGMLLISVLFPLTLPPQYTPQLAATIAAQPDWYFLWIYQILKISLFEGAGLTLALSLVTIVLTLFVILPFIDRGERRRIIDRPKFVTAGAIFVAELAVLAVWGLLTPGQVIPALQGVLVLGGTAMVVALVLLGTLRMLSSRAQTVIQASPAATTRMTRLRVGVAWTILVGFGALSIGSSIDSVVGLALYGVTSGGLARLALSLLALAVVTFFTVCLIYRVELRGTSLKTRVRFLETGRDRVES